MVLKKDDQLFLRTEKGHGAGEGVKVYVYAYVLIAICDDLS